MMKRSKVNGSIRWKKIVCAMLAGTLVLGLTSCGEKKGSETVSQLEKEEEKITAESFQTDAVIQETVLMDQSDFKITATGLTYDTYSANLHLKIENKGQTNYSVSSNTLGYASNAVNGYMVDDGYLSVDVAPGEEVSEQISFDINGLMIHGITEIADIWIGFDVEDDEYNEIYRETCQVKTSSADSYDYSKDTYKKAIVNEDLQTMFDYSIDFWSEETLYDQNEIKIVSEGLMTNTDGERSLLIEVENNSSELGYAVVENISINGEAVYEGTWMYDSIMPGMKRVMGISIDSLLESADTETDQTSENMKEITFDFAAKDIRNNWKSPQETITIQFE